MTWARTSLRRLRDAPAAALAVALLILVTAFVFAAGPRLLDTLADRAVRDEVRAAPPTNANVQLTALTRLLPATGAPLDSVRLQGEGLEARLPSEVQALVVDRHYVVETPRFSIRASLAERGTVAMRFQDGVADRIEYTAGRAPTAATRDVDAASVAGLGSLGEGVSVPVLETAMSGATAALLGFHVGDVVGLWLDGSDLLVGSPGNGGAPCAIEIVGTFRALDEANPVWYREEGLLRASTRVYGPSLAINDARILMAPDAYAAVMQLTDAVHLVVRYQWRYFVDPDRIEARKLNDLAAALQRMETTFPTAATAARQAGTAQLTSGLADLLLGFRTRWSFATTVMAAGAVGPAAMALGALGLIALISARGRRSVLGRWRVRGASTRQVLRATVAEGLLVAGPAVVAGTAVAIVLVAGGPPDASLAAGGVVLVAGVGLVGLLEIPPALVPKAGGSADRDETLGARVADVRPDRRSIAAELTVVLLAVAAIVLLRTRGSGASAATVSGGAVLLANPLLVAAPALGGIAAAILGRRLIPAPIRGLANLAARRRDLVPVLAMRRAGRTGGPAAVLVILLAMAAIAVFGAATVTSLDHGADVVAWQEVGADYRVASAFRQLPGGFDPATIPGVRASTLAYRGTASVDADLTANDLLVLDVPSYEALVQGTPADPGIPAELHEARPLTLPVILSTVTATRAGRSVGDRFVLLFRSTRFDAHVAAIRDVFPSLPANGTFAVVSQAQVATFAPALSLPPTDAFVAAPDGTRGALVATLSSLGVSIVQVDGRAEIASSLRDRPVNRAVAIVLLAATVVAAAYAVLALVASLALAGAERSIEVAHLRMLGLARRGATTLLAFEYGPVLALALVAGALVGLALFAVLGGALGLGVLLGSSLEIPLALDPGLLGLALGGIVAVTVLSIVVAGTLGGSASAAGAVRRGIE